MIKTCPTDDHLDPAALTGESSYYKHDNSQNLEHF